MLEGLISPAFWPTAVVGLVVFFIIKKLMKTEVYTKFFINSHHVSPPVKPQGTKDPELPQTKISQPTLPITTTLPNTVTPPNTANSCCKSTPSESSSNGCCNSTPGESSSNSCCKSTPISSCSDTEKPPRKVTIIYGSTTGKSAYFSTKLATKLSSLGLFPRVLNAADLGAKIEDQMKVVAGGEKPLLVVIISTYTEGSPPESASWFYNWLSDMAGDFRVSHNMLVGLGYTVFGLGDSLYTEHYNTVGRDVDRFLHQLQGDRVHPLGLGDENVSNSKAGSMEGDFDDWSERLAERLRETRSGEDAVVVEEEEEDFSASEDDSEAEEENDIIDLEDIGKVIKKGKMKEPVSIGEPKEMVTPMLRKSLTKQGYKIIGTHSGVKLCRWTKSMLRGRGGCYKHTFYGIESHRCMETTPSLACANKCVFCWRHHSNPVGTEWRWKMESAEFILAGALGAHYKMINEFKGVPGVLADKLEEGMRAKHCALSLVGEPIMYPEINKFVQLLHKEKISSFLVTNAQFPDAIRDMEPCTQLYVSIDASTKDSLKKIDRPLFKDFWERFLASLAELKHKGQRTVYRLTLVKGWNAEEMDNYAKLVEIGQPDLIEIKGVTFCGDSKASTLTMENVPWHEEVVKFVSDLVERLPGYGIACEHEHSNCILVASERFQVEGQWMTWIDYDKFHQLVEEYHETGKTFSGLDYMAPTPSWATYGAGERGFDPLEKRWYRKGKAEVNVDGGCG
eukprot:GFUD01006152.1.p1 GENE.GFUD01006152.1~~GFUD01006152.1.p1  ORF type:complete len:735 (-),score=197.38 GFUD01006152.1:138-2342(-)